VPVTCDRGMSCFGVYSSTKKTSTRVNFQPTTDRLLYKGLNFQVRLGASAKKKTFVSPHHTIHERKRAAFNVRETDSDSFGWS
jgi:hypothetical protein